VDILRGTDVFHNFIVYTQRCNAADLVHFAPNCATFSRAREIPIPGCSNPPKPLRTETDPEGAGVKMSVKEKQRVALDTRMAVDAADKCLARLDAGLMFSLEHTGRSLALHLASWKTLCKRKGVLCTFYHTCMFEGSQRRKYQILIHNMPKVGSAVSLLCSNKHNLCDRTGKPHDSFSPVISRSGIRFPTSDEREYPVGWCRSYAQGLKQELQDKNFSSFTFLEIYSGLNAPLSVNVARTFGVEEPVPVVKLDDVGIKGEKQSLEDLAVSQLVIHEGTHSSGPETNVSQPALEQHASVANLMLDPSSVKIAELVPIAEVDSNRAAMLESGRQPRWGKNNQLIADGMNDPYKHLATARLLKHPSDSLSALHEDHEDSVRCLSILGRDIVKERLHRLATLSYLASSPDFVKQKMEDDAMASATAKQLGCKPNVGLMKFIQQATNIEDVAVPDLCAQGMPIIGPALESPFFSEHIVPAEMTICQFLQSAKSRRMQVFADMRKAALSADPNMVEAIFNKTCKEVEAGTMGRPMTPEQAEKKYGPFYNVIPSFGLQQGVDSDGCPKFRRIDDHTRGGCNKAAERRQKINMAMVAHVMLMVRLVSVFFSPEKWPHDDGIPHACTEDMKGAYRQVPLMFSQIIAAITAVLNTSGGFDLYEMFGQPFGAGHAVPNFYRVAEWLCRATRRYFSIVMDHFFDDFFIVEPQFSIQSAVFCFRRACQLLGFELDSAKSQMPACMCGILGVLFNTSAIRSERKLFVQSKPSRISNLTIEINAIVKADKLAPSHAARVIGKFGFIADHMYGRVGRAAMGALRHRQYSHSHDHSLTPSIKASLGLALALLHTAPPREISVSPPSERPTILYTDASDVPGRDVGQYIVGAVLDSPSQSTLLYTYWCVPPELVQRWIPKQTQIGQLEIFAGAVAVDAWADLLRDKQVLHFVDNDSATASLVKGYSPQEDSCALVGDYWLRVAALKASVYVDRVESKSNLADGPSRVDLQEVATLGAKFTPPCTDLFMQQLHPDPFFWFCRDPVSGVGIGGVPTAWGRGPPPCGATRKAERSE